MDHLVKQINGYINVYSDDKTGLVWTKDTKTGIGACAHSCISSSDKAGRRSLNRYWRKFDRIIECEGWLYNIDKFICNPKNDLQVIAAELCMCEACIERRKDG